MPGFCARSGEIWFDGRRIDGVEAPDRVGLGIALVPEGRRLFSRLTVADNLRLGTFRDRDPKRRQEMLERVFGLFPCSERAGSAPARSRAARDRCSRSRAP